VAVTCVYRALFHLIIQLLANLAYSRHKHCFLSKYRTMGCASGKKPSAHCQSLDPTGSQAVLHIQVPASLVLSDAPAAGAPAPVSQLLSGEVEDRPKATKPALPPKKPLLQAQASIQALASLPSKSKLVLKTAPKTIAICPVPAEPALASARDITGSKAAFDKGKFRLVNTGPLVQRSEEIGEKSLSSICPQAPLLVGSGSGVRPAQASLEGTRASASH